jgi:hypothetical protein
MQVPDALKKTETYFSELPSPTGRGWRVAPGEGGPPHDLQRLTESWGELPSSGAAAPPSPNGEGHASSAFRYLGQLLS